MSAIENYSRKKTILVTLNQKVTVIFTEYGSGMQKMDDTGIEPVTSTMLKLRATNCANRPIELDIICYRFCLHN